MTGAGGAATCGTLAQSSALTTSGVRARFEEACTLVAPCFDPARQWGKQPLNHLAMRILRERFTDLGDAELMVMLNGIRRLHDKRRAPAPSSC